VAMAPVSRAVVAVAPGLSLEVAALRNEAGGVGAVHAVRVGNQAHRSYLIAPRGLGVWPDGGPPLGLAADGTRSAPVCLDWVGGAPALRNLSHPAVRCDGHPVPRGAARHLSPGQRWSLGPLELEVTDELLPERA